MQLNNDTGSEVFVPADVQGCDPFAVEIQRDGIWEPVPLAFNDIPAVCGGCSYLSCDYRTNFVAVFSPVAPSATVELSWDARALLTWDSLVACPYGGTIVGKDGVLQLATSGHYRITVGFEVSPPDNCVQHDATGKLTCTGSSFLHAPGIASLCGTTHTVSTEFDLPEIGDVSVSVDLGSSRS